MNPYNCSLPGNLFTGYDDIRKKMIDGLLQGQRSFAVHGGRRCGKTSLLLQLGKDLSTLALHGLCWRMIDMQAVVPRTAADLFAALYREIVRDIPNATDVHSSPRHYQDFLSLLDDVQPTIEKEMGVRWTMILIVDDFDVAAATLPDDEVFQNLRSFLTFSHHASSFRLVVAGSSRMNELIKAGSPLNNLDPIFLGILPAPNASEIVSAGFQDASFEQELFAETGRHPFILQGILGYLWDERDHLDLALAARRFTRDRIPNFKQWIRDIGNAGTDLYAKLAGSSDGLPLGSLKVKGAMVDEVLQTLSYHGLIDDSEPDRPRISSQVFRRWFQQNIDVESNAPVIRPQPIRGKRVFVVHGRNLKIRTSMFRFLRELGLQPMDWGELVELTGNAAPTIIEILQAGFKTAQAAVVVFTPEDEARLLPPFVADTDPPYERELTPQPRPNVLFEAGMVMAHFPQRTVIVQLGRIRPFTDLAGVHFINLNNSIQARGELVRRLRIAGCAIEDTETNIGWHNAGNFDT
jgi:predicted nucleotide-binding protein